MDIGSMLGFIIEMARVSLAVFFACTSIVLSIIGLRLFKNRNVQLHNDLDFDTKLGIDREGKFVAVKVLNDRGVDKLLY